MLRHKIISKDEPFSAGFVVNQLESDDKQNELLDDRHRIAGKLMIIHGHFCRAVDFFVSRRERSEPVTNTSCA